MRIPQLQHLQQELRARAEDKDEGSKGISPTIVNLLFALLALLIVSILLAAALFLLRRQRRRNAVARQALPTHHRPLSTGHRRERLTITTNPGGRSSTLYVFDEKCSHNGELSPPLTPDSVPEIRITFPDEQDEMTGQRKEGRVVVVRVGDQGGVGLEPVRDDEPLPKYEKGNGWDTLDMDTIGGLKEKKQWS